MKKVVFTILLGVIISGFTTSKKVEKLIAKEVKSVFKVESYAKQPIYISDEINKELPIKITENNFYKVIKDGSLLGYYFLGQAYGKADYFDFIVILDKDLIVSKVKVLVYREDHGGEVGSKRWLKQFKGKTKNQELKYQKDIAAISGATLSARSMTLEINKLLKTVAILYNKQKF